VGACEFRRGRESATLRAADGSGFCGAGGARGGRVLERVLRASEAHEWEVFNFGRRGADFPARYDNFKELLAYDPDIVLYGMVLNDCEQSRAFRARHAFVTAYIDAHEQQLAPWTGLPAFGTRTALFAQHRLEQSRWLDLLPTPRGRSANDLWVHPLDAHPSALAHRLVAKDLARVVRRLVERDSRPEPPVKPGTL
jgi:hypothetical protein